MKLQRRILIVDDDASILDALEIVLQDAGFLVERAMKASQIYALSLARLPDIILLDMLLSGNDGREITMHLKSQHETKNIPIIMMSAHPGAQNEAKYSGADDFIAKPFTIDSLLEKIDQF